MKAIRLLLKPLTFITVCCTCWPQQRGVCEELDRPPVSIALREIRIRPDHGEETLKANVHLSLCNRSKKALCVLPSEWSLNYNIYYSNDGFDFEGDRTQTRQWPEPKDISELDLKSVIVAPGGRANLVFEIFVQRPRGLAGQLELECQCKPAYPGATYRGIPVYRDVVMRMKSEVKVVEDPKTGEIVIRPVAPARRPEALPPSPPCRPDSQ